MTKIVKILDTNLHGSLQSMICQQVTLSGDAEWPKVADAVIEAAMVYAAAEVPLTKQGGFPTAVFVRKVEEIAAKEFPDDAS
jgi:hypothetical protein